MELPPGQPMLLEIDIIDNGRGIALAKTGPGLHHGLENMRRRLAELNGVFDIGSEPAGGTRVSLKVHVGAATR